MKFVNGSKWIITNALLNKMLRNAGNEYGFIKSMIG